MTSEDGMLINSPYARPQMSNNPDSYRICVPIFINQCSYFLPDTGISVPFS